MQKDRSFLDKIYLFIKGIAMGAANKVPGVSGGTVSYVFDFYEELIYSFRRINIDAFKLLFTGKFKSFYKYTNGQFLTLVMGGSIFSYFSFSFILDYFLKHYELYVWSCFFGMIIGSIYYIGKDFGKWSRVSFVFLLIGISFDIILPNFFGIFAGLTGLTDNLTAFSILSLLYKLGFFAKEFFKFPFCRLVTFFRNLNV